VVSVTVVVDVVVDVDVDDVVDVVVETEQKPHVTSQDPYFWEEGPNNASHTLFGVFACVSCWQSLRQS